MNLELGKKLRRIREQQGYSQDFVAFKLKISQRAYSKIERCEVKASLDKLEILAELFGLSLSELIIFDERVILNNNTSTKINDFYKNIELLTKVMTKYDTKITYLEEELNKLKAYINPDKQEVD